MVADERGVYRNRRGDTASVRGRHDSNLWKSRRIYKVDVRGGTNLEEKRYPTESGQNGYHDCRGEHRSEYGRI